MINRNKKAVSFIEIMIVLVILLILGGMTFVSLSGHMLNSRDSARITEIDNLVISLESYILKNGKLPKPSNSKDITYSGSEVLSQGTIGKDVLEVLGYSSTNILDPKTNNEYTYSVKNNKKEFQVAGILENKDNLYLLSSAYVDYGIVALLKGNYNGGIVYTKSGAISNILSLPSIVSSNLTSTDLVDIIDNKFLVYNGHKNLPASFEGSGYNLDNNVDYSANKLVIYSGSLSSLGEEEERLFLLNNLKESYSGVDVKSIVGNNFLSSVSMNEINVIFPDIDDKNLACDLVNYKLNYKVDCNHVRFSAFYVLEDPNLLSNISFEGLEGVQVNYILQDTNDLRFGTSNGIYLYNITNSTWTYFEDTSGYSITVIEVDNNGDIWFGTSESGILVYDGSDFENYRSSSIGFWGVIISYLLSTDEIPNNAIYDIVLDPDSGNMIIGTYGGGSYYNSSSEEFSSFYVKRAYFIPSFYKQNHIKDSFIDSNGYLWLGTDNGIYKYNGDPSSPLPTTGNSNYISVGLTNTKIRDIDEDSSLNIWLGTNKGIYEIDGNSPHNLLNTYKVSTGNGLSSDDIYTVFEDTNTSNMWFGTSEGVSVLSGSTFTNYNVDLEGNSLGTVFYIYQDENGLNILGTSDGPVTLE